MAAKSKKDKVMKMVRDTLKRNPDTSNDKLYEKAKKIDSSIDKLTLRQFHARFPLQVKRKMARKKKTKKTKKKKSAATAGAAGSNVDRTAVRETLLRFAKEVTAADGPAMIDLLTDGIEGYVDDVIYLVGAGG